jgi:hypothetical protein
MKSTRFFYRYGAFLLLTLTLGACSWILPDDTSAPRYNGVSGERHVPKLNPQSTQGSQNNTPSAADTTADTTTAADTTVADNPNFPPVDAVTKARAEQEISSAPLAEPVAAPAPTSSAASSPSTAPSLPSATLSGDRHVPVENSAPTLTVSQNTYPDLATVPPRPAISGDDSAAARLSKVRTQLENDRTNADAAKDQLSHDAASEPSMLQNPPELTGTVPPPMPVTQAPIAPPVSITPPPSRSAPAPMQTPAPQTSNAPHPGVIAQAPFPVFAPPPPPMDGGALPPANVSISPMRMSAAPTPMQSPATRVNIPVPMNTASAAPAISYTPAPPSYSPAPMLQPAPIILHPLVGDASAANVPAPCLPRHAGSAMERLATRASFWQRRIRPDGRQPCCHRQQPIHRLCRNGLPAGFALYLRALVSLSVRLTHSPPRF